MMSPWWFSIVLNILLIDQTSSHYEDREYHKPNHCYADEQNPYLYFASKTSYNAVYKPSNRNVIPDECTPAQIWMLVRHGTRYPLMKKMKGFQELSKLRDEIIKNHERKNLGGLCEKDLENLKNWKMKDVPLSESDHLTEEGFRDLRDIGNRTQAKFHNLFNKPYTNENYKLQYTKHSKTMHSAEAFASGLFKNNAFHIPEPKDDDLLPQIYPDCKVAPLPNANDPYQGGRMERSLFKDGHLVAHVVHSVNRRLGFLNRELTIDDVEQLYDICRYEKSWEFEKLAPWCAVFTAEELQILEYIGDLSYYYNSGHGYSANLRTGCPLVKDMIDRFSDLANDGSKQPSAVFYFGHSTTIYNLFARLGLAKDPEHITHENYYELLETRKWHTSLLAPFSGNFAAVFLRCSSGMNNRVVFYHNEEPYLFPGCNSYACNWITIRDKYKKITDPATCNFDFCSKSSSTDGSNSTDGRTNEASDKPSHIANKFSTHASITTVDASDRVQMHDRPGQGENNDSRRIVTHKIRNDHLDHGMNLDSNKLITSNKYEKILSPIQHHEKNLFREGSPQEANQQDVELTANDVQENNPSLYRHKFNDVPHTVFVLLSAFIALILFYVIYRRVQTKRVSDIKFNRLVVEFRNTPLKC